MKIALYSFASVLTLAAVAGCDDSTTVLPLSGVKVFNKDPAPPVTSFIDVLIAEGAKPARSEVADLLVSRNQWGVVVTDRRSGVVVFSRYVPTVDDGKQAAYDFADAFRLVGNPPAAAPKSSG